MSDTNLKVRKESIRTLERLGILQEPIGYVAGRDLYEYCASNPADFVDPQGTTATATAPSPASQPSAPAGLTQNGNGTWGTGDSQIKFKWSSRPVVGSESHAGDKAVLNALNLKGPGAFFSIQINKTEKCPYDGFQWIEYSVVTQNGAIYHDGAGKAYVGIDTGGRSDGRPYSQTTSQQSDIDQGKGKPNAWWNICWQAGYYDPTGFDSTFIDLQASGGNVPWKQESTVVLLGLKNHQDTPLGVWKFVYEIGSNGKLAYYGGLPPTQDDLKEWNNSLKSQYPGYIGKLQGLPTTQPATQQSQ